MSSNVTTPTARRPRLNPFAFPSDTTLRFILLATFVVCGSGLLHGKLHGPTDAVVSECLSRLSSELSKLDMSTPAAADRNADIIWKDVIPTQARCSALLRPGAVWQMGGMLLAVVVAAVFYFFYPRWILWRDRLEPISASELPELEQELDGIMEAARLADRPALVWNPLATGLPLAFGRRGRHYVALSGSFVTQYFYKDRAAFRAVMLHELAHIRNGDVHKTYLTISLLLSFAATAVAPSLVASLWFLTTVHWTDAALLLLLGMFWTSVVILSGLAVLRVREYYADVQASICEQTSEIDRVLAALPAPAGQGWRRFLRFHPDSRERRRIVEDPSRLFGLSFAHAFGIGVAAWAIIDVATSVLLPFLPLRGPVELILFWSSRFIVSAVIFIFAIGAIGIGVWRGAFASLVKGDRPSKGTAWLGAALVAGSFPDVVLSVAEAALQSFRGQSVPLPALLTAFQMEMVTYIILLLGCLLIFRWISGTASAWFEVAWQSRSPRPLLLLSVATALILVVGTLASASFAVMFSFLTTPWLTWGPNWIYAYGPLAGAPILLASLAVWAFPLAAPWWRRGGRPTVPADWVFLDGASLDPPTQEPLRRRGALLTGIVMGLIFWLLWQLVYFRGHLSGGISDAIHSAFRALAALAGGNEGFLLSGSAVVFQAVAAAIAAGGARRLSAIQGLFAASIAGFVIIAGNFVFFGIVFDSPMADLIQAALATMGLGAAVSLPTAIVAAWIGNVARRVSSASSTIVRRPV